MDGTLPHCNALCGTKVPMLNHVTSGHSSHIEYILSFKVKEKWGHLGTIFIFFTLLTYLKKRVHFGNFGKIYISYKENFVKNQKLN